MATTAFLYKNEKLRHSPGRPSRSDFVQSEFEEIFLQDFQNWYRERQEKNLDASEIALSVEQLYQIKALDIVDGKIYLKEHVVGKM